MDKVKIEELLRWYENGIEGRSFRWFDIDTSFAEKMSDEELLSRMTHVPAVEIPGWGLIAELCKRFNRQDSIDSKSSEFSKEDKEKYKAMLLSDFANKCDELRGKAESSRSVDNKYGKEYLA